jgi:glycosyltransferase involved in cell wall biosynthesis
MQSEPVFSIVIPTYNRAGFIRKTIQSVLDQTFGDFEVIVVDDGSTDNTAEIVQSITDERLIYLRKDNAERAAARNLGTRHARGSYVTFLDSDDLLYPHHFETAYKTLREKGVLFFHLGYEIRHERTGRTRRIIPPRGDLNRKLIEGNFMSCNGVFMHRDVALSNLFNEDRALSAMEDWELWLRVATQYPIHYEPAVTSTIIDHDDRSVLQTDPQTLIRRVELLLQYVMENKAITDFYRDGLSRFRSSCYTYISLHIALTKKNRKSAIRYLWKGIAAAPSRLFQRRTAAIIKHLILA